MADHPWAGIGETFRSIAGRTWDWGASRFDLVVGIYFQFAGPAARTQIFCRMQDVLPPGGLLLIAGYTPAQLAAGTGGPSQVKNFCTETLLRESLAAGEILHLAECEAELIGGPCYVGRSAVMDLVARKPAHRQGAEKPYPVLFAALATI